MNKDELILNYLKLLAQMQSLGLELAETNKYDNLKDFVNDVLKKVSKPAKKPKKKNTTFGYVNRNATLFETEDETIPIYGDGQIGKD
jgi:uncharacterized spore protein YtfJ